MIDLFTKWIELSALKDETARTVARKVSKVFRCFPNSRAILTDQAKNFECDLMRSLCGLLQIKSYARLRTTRKKMTRRNESQPATAIRGDEGVGRDVAMGGIGIQDISATPVRGMRRMSWGTVGRQREP